MKCAADDLAVAFPCEGKRAPSGCGKLARIVLSAIICACVVSGQEPAGVRLLRYEEVRDILQTVGADLPEDVKQTQSASQWNAWVAKRDAEIRSRLLQGDEDTIVNFLMFGTSYTSEPRVTSAELRTLAERANSADQAATKSLQSLLLKRIADLIAVLKKQPRDERVEFVRMTMVRRHVDTTGASGDAAMGAYLAENVRRVLREQASFQQVLASAHSMNDATEEFAERSTLYKERGLSLDTSLPPDFALEVALKEMKNRGLLRQGQIVRVGVIGPGLDFTDKQEGYDFYPLQTVQPFAVADSLLRLRLLREPGWLVVTMDISPRVAAHMRRIQQLVRSGKSYELQLPRDQRWNWDPELVRYWKQFGDRIGSTVPPARVPKELEGVELRAVRVRPDILSHVEHQDVNAILARPPLKDDEKFDLLIATNILVYYDTFEQELALANFQAMLKPGGFLLTNNLLLELPVLKMKSVDEVTVPYSNRGADGDHIVWYQRVP